jgi:hypothetical protein
LDIFVNFRKDTINWRLLHDDDLQRLHKNDKIVLETWFPLKQEEYFGKMRYDGQETRMALLSGVQEGRISLKVAHLEVRRRRRMKSG